MSRKTRTPKIVAPPAPALPEPKACQYPLGCRTGSQPFASLTFKSQAGLVWSQASCQSHMELSADYYRAQGGELLEVRLLAAEVAS